ncbi:hypothetical protein OSB04_005209 [Centaurea solstitialis]|uniref:Uncharacterized protein n=1 Tax=Centaurea solstitialis TaxID=347529 RepID=A0AA38THC3_9ASTR|nr:hypothetical protein OSB04_005209 [Centaurea solstitialis]
MEPNEILMSRGGGGGGGGNTSGKPGEGFIDRSKVRILLCDNDTKSSEEVFILLCKCSYQVTTARSPRQVIDALNAEGPDIDIILSEVDLPMAKGLKMLKYIMRDKDLRRIPVISKLPFFSGLLEIVIVYYLLFPVMSAQDEVALVVKCLRLGAADYLVKPLRTNELLNLWTHMWRRRRMLGLAEKNIMNCEFDLVPSDPSDANTNSTTLFSDDTDEMSGKNSNPEMPASIPCEDESNVVMSPGLVNIQLINSSDDQPNIILTPELTRLVTVYPGKLISGPKKNELRIGQSSAFFTYVKSSMFRSGATIDEATPPPLLDNKLDLSDENGPQYVHVEEKVSAWGEHDYTQAQENFHSNDSFPDSVSLDGYSTPQPECSQQMNSKTIELPEPQMQQSGNNYHPDVSRYNPYSAYPYYHLSGPTNHAMYQQNMNDLQNQYCPPHHMPGMASFPYYPVSFCVPGQMPPAMQPWPSFGSSSSNNVKVNKVDRREAALLKFRQKRKERCFDKKVRYVNRKKLAERRPRVRGQFVRKINGINVDLNGHPASTDFDEDDDDYEEEEDQTGGD